ncbi:MAK10-like protein [Tanacetum coccineum]|uniref:MAK10-like protein n=1 Tax=Tanacetum coccineum TaxID=301880 RepID=A0ABQ5ECB3_9ASTR
MWYLFDPTLSGWCKTDAYSTDFGLRIQINTSRIFLNLWTHLTLTVTIGSITTREDLTTRFLAQFFPPGRTAKPRNVILMFQQHHGESLSEAWTRFKDLLRKFPHHGIDLCLEDLALYDNESWNDPMDFAKMVKAIAFPQDVPSTFDRCLIKLENQVQHLMEAHLTLTQPTQVNKITISCKIPAVVLMTLSIAWKISEQAFVKYASSRTDKEGEERAYAHRGRSYVPENKPLPDSTYTPDPSITFITEKVLKFNLIFESLVLVPPSPNAELVCTKEEDGDVMFIKIISRDDNSHKEEPEPGVQEVEYFDIFPTRSELAYHKYLMYGPIPSIFLRNPIIIEGIPLNLKIPCNIGHVHVIFDERKLWKFLGSFIGRFSEDDLISFRIFKMQRFKRCQSSVTSSEMKPSMGFIDEEIVNRNWKHNTVQLAKIREVLLRKNASSTEQPVRTGTKQ